jgi:hypothetical protein
MVEEEKGRKVGSANRRTCLEAVLVRCLEQVAPGHFAAVPLKRRPHLAGERMTRLS